MSSMNLKSHHIQMVYVTLILLNTLAASLIWGINTLFLLDAGLSNLEAFAANAFFTAGQVIFEIPTGIIADTWGRRASYLLGAFTLMVSTLAYLFIWHTSAPFWAWALASMFLGLGFTFFSGAVEAWLVDALHFTGYKGSLEPVFAKGQIAAGVAMLGGSVAGGLIAQATSLGVPYILRAAILGVTFIVAFVLMRDLGFTPDHGKQPIRHMKRILRSSIDHGLRNPPVKWIMLTAPFATGVGIYAFYAMQPYLLQLYGDPSAYGIAGLTAAIVAGAQIVGGLTAAVIHRFFQRRTSILLLGAFVSAAALCLIGLTTSFWVAVVLISLWGLMFAATAPVRQSYLNGLIPSEDRATVLSFDALLGSSGGVVIQPALGKAADVWGYGTSYVLGAGFELAALPFILFARRRKASSDALNKATDLNQTGG